MGKCNNISPILPEKIFANYISIYIFVICVTYKWKETHKSKLLKIKRKTSNVTTELKECKLLPLIVLSHRKSYYELIALQLQFFSMVVINSSMSVKNIVHPVTVNNVFPGSVWD